MNDSLDIISLGECMIELSTGASLIYAQTFNKYFGGDSLNTAVAAARLGSKTGYISKIGNDSFKDYLLDAWQSENLDISQVKIVEGYNGLYIISRQEDGKKEFAYYRKKSAATTLSTDDVSEEYIAQASIVYSTGITQSLSTSASAAVKKAFCLAKENESLVAYDPNYRARLWDVGEAKEAMEDVIEDVDIMLLSDTHDAEVLINQSSPDKMIKYFWDRGVSMVVVKQGEAGSTIGYNGEVSHLPARDVRIIDTTGAGDSFNGGFLHGIARGYTPFEAAKIATVVASEQVKGLGAIKSIPYKDQVYAELKSCD